MIANFFNKTKPITSFSIVILLFAYYCISILMGDFNSFSVLFIVDKLFYFFWYVLFLLIVNFIIKKNKLTQDNSYALLLIVFMLGTFPKTIFLNYIVFSNITLLLSYRKIYSLRSEINTKIKLFDAAFWIGISTLIYSWSALYIFLIYIGIFIYQKVSFKNLLIPIVGFITPVFIYFTYSFYFDSLTTFYERFDYNFNLVFIEYNSLKFLMPIILLIIILLWSILLATPKIILISNTLKFSWSVLINHLLISIVIIIFSPVKNGAEFFYLVFPASIIITNFLERSKSTIFKNILLYLFLAISISVYFL